MFIKVYFYSVDTMLKIYVGSLTEKTTFDRYE